MREWLKKICGPNMGENKARIFVLAYLVLGVCLASMPSGLTRASSSQPIANLSDAPRLKAKVIDSNIYTAMSQVWWMDNDRLILNGAYPANERDASRRDWGILVLDTRDNRVQVYQSNKNYSGGGGVDALLFLSKN